MNIFSRLGVIGALVLLAILGIGGFLLLRSSSTKQLSKTETQPLVSEGSTLPTTSPVQEPPPEKIKTPSSQANTEPPSKPVPSDSASKIPSTAAKLLTLQFVNQYNVTYANIYNDNRVSGPYLLDALGEQVTGRFTIKLDEKERFNQYTFDKEILPGTYIVGWYDGKSTKRLPDQYGQGSHLISPGKQSVERHYSAGTRKVVVPSNGSWFVSIPIEQTRITYFDAAYITFTVTNELGTLFQCDTAVVYDSNGKRQGDGVGYNGEVCRVDFIGHAMPPGTYTIKIKKDGYQAKDVDFVLPDVSTWSDEKIWAEQPGVIDLGTMILKKL